MLYRIISLAFLLILVIFFNSEILLHADDKGLLLPKEKPIFKISNEITKNVDGKVVPVPKPVVKEKKDKVKKEKIKETKENF